MTDEEDADGPAVELGEGSPVDGAPVARVASRLTWGIARSEIERREGDTTVRTPDGPRELQDVLADVEIPYFATRQEFLQAAAEAVGTGPVPTGE